MGYCSYVDCDLVQRASAITGSRQSDITDALMRENIQRPEHARFQSRANNTE